MIKIHFGGSRNLSDVFYPQVAQVISAVMQMGCFVHVGCATGADEAVIEAALGCDPSRLSVFAQFSESGEGSFSASAFIPVLAAKKAGAPVSFLAGGPLSIPLKQRLMLRSLAALSGCAGSVFFLASSFSPGSLKVAAAAAKKNQIVYAIPCGFSGSPVPLRTVSGSWQESQFFGTPCFQWFTGKPLF
jgi:hypothetical protein